jgi:hypothetical protein
MIIFKSTEELIEAHQLARNMVKGDPILKSLVIDLMIQYGCQCIELASQKVYYRNEVANILSLKERLK